MAGAATAAMHGLALERRRRHAHGRRDRGIDRRRRRRGPLLRAAEDEIQEPFGARRARRGRERNNDEHTEKHGRARYFDGTVHTPTHATPHKQENPER